MMRLALTVLLMEVCGIASSYAQTPSFLDGFTLRLAKAPDAKDASKPAMFGYQRNDGGKSDYITQGALKADYDFAEINTFSPNISWNHNSLATTPTDTWSAALAMRHAFVLNPALDTIVLSESLSAQHDAAKSSRSSIAKVSLNWYGWPEWKKVGTPDYAAIRPTATLFAKHVS